MALTFAVITVITFILLANVRMTLIVVLCIAFTITNVTGYAYFGGLTIEIVTSMILIMSVGLALDYSAHIAVAFITSSKPTRNGAVNNFLQCERLLKTFLAFKVEPSTL